MQERPLYLDDLRRACWIDEDPARYVKNKKGVKTSNKNWKNELHALHTPNDKRLSGGLRNRYDNNDQENTTSDEDADVSYVNENSLNNSSAGLSDNTPGIGCRPERRTSSRHIRFDDGESSQEEVTPRGTKR